MGAILLQNVGGTAWFETNILIPNLAFRSVLKATLITFCFIFLTSNFSRFNARF